jgi:hypothetical protein
MAHIKKIINKNRSKVYTDNSVIIDTDPEKMYNSMYPILNIDDLNSYVENIDKKDKLDMLDLFEVEKIINKIDKPNCISVSFFCQRVSNTYPNQYGTINFYDEKSDWYKKYYVKLLQLIIDFNDVKHKKKYKKTYKIRIYLEQQLSVFIPILSKENVEIYLMKNNSIGGMPGMLWRYLVFDDKDIEIAHAFDIDESFALYTTYMDKFSSSNKVFGRCLVNCESSYKIKIDSPVINYPVVLGGIIGMRPKLIELNFKDTMINYMLFRKERLNSVHPNLENDTDLETIYNMPIGNHTYGLGGHWCMYGFDEKMWKHIFYPYFVKRGEVVSFISNNQSTINKLDNIHPSKIDYNFCKLYNNEFII